jgi:hypothetical protein
MTPLIEFEGSLEVTNTELAEAQWNPGLAVQNAIGHTGAVVDFAEVNEGKGPKPEVSP